MDNLNGSVLRITTRYDNLYSYDVRVQNCDNGTSPRNSTSECYILTGGYAVGILFELSALLNFSYELVPSVNAYDFNKATEESIDLFASSYSLHESRARTLDFTFTTGKSKVAAFINHQFEASNKDVIFGPFELRLWLVFLGLFFVLAGAMMAVSMLEKQSILDALFQSLSLLLQKDSEFRVEKNTSRLVMWIAGLVSIIISSTYTGNGASIKSINRYYINSLESLADSDYEIHLEYGFNNGSTIQTIAEGIQEHQPAIRRILTKSSESKFVFCNFRQAIREVNVGQVAYIIDEETGFSAVQAELVNFPCSWGLIEFQIAYPWTMYMRKNSPYRAALNSGLLKLHQVGLTGILRKRWVPHRKECVDSNRDFISVSLIELRYAYAILALGFAIAGALVTLESFYQKYFC